MSRIALIDPEDTRAERRALLDQIQAAFAVPVDFPSVPLNRPASAAAGQPR